MDAPVYFASDSHFGAGPASDQRERRDLFLRWLARIEDGAHLYLVGDIFDFWLDYPTYMPKPHLEILYGLKRLADRGVQLGFVGGNHDVWCAEFLEESLGVRTLPSGAVVTHQDRRIRLHHGDGLLSGDRFYEAFRWAVRNPVLVFLAKSIHPELLHRFADALSRRSRARERDDAPELLRRMREFGRQNPQRDVDHLIIGHVHLPHQEGFDGWTLTCLGDWLQHRSAAKLVDGRLSLVDVEREFAGG